MLDALGLDRELHERRRDAVADLLAIAIAIVTFAFLFWAIDLIDRI